MMTVERRTLSDAATCDLFARRLGEKSGTGQTARRGRSINLVYETFVERDINANRATGIAQQRHGKQDGTYSHSLPDIVVAQNVINRTGWRHRPTGTLQCFYVLAQSRRRIRGRFRQSITRRETSLHIRKPDSERAIGVLLDDRYILGRHAHIFFHRNDCELLSDPHWQPSWSPSRKLVDPSHEPDRQILAWVRDRYERLPIRMLERVVIPAHAIQNPTILLQHPDQLAAVSFHVATSSSAAGKPCRKVLTRSRRWPPLGGGMPYYRVYKYTHFSWFDKS